MKAFLKCIYCGSEWEEFVYMAESIDYVHCPKCRDNKPKHIKEQVEKIDTYKGAPPFPKKD